jgi:hypothetical protein
MAGRRIIAPAVTGTGLSTAAVTGLACLDPAPAWGFPHLSARHPLASYVALGAAPLGSFWETFALVALIFAACFFVAWRRRLHRAPLEQPANTGGRDGA